VFFYTAATQCAIVVNNRAIALYQKWYRHDTWQYRGITIYRDLFDTGIKTLVLMILIEASK